MLFLVIFVHDGDILRAKWTTRSSTSDPTYQMTRQVLHTISNTSDLHIIFSVSDNNQITRQLQHIRWTTRFSVSDVHQIARQMVHRIRYVISAHRIQHIRFNASDVCVSDAHQINTSDSTSDGTPDPAFQIQGSRWHTDPAHHIQRYRYPPDDTSAPAHQISTPDLAFLIQYIR